jgi:hypothetical protein
MAIKVPAWTKSSIMPGATSSVRVDTTPLAANRINMASKAPEGNGLFSVDVQLDHENSVRGLRKQFFFEKKNQKTFDSKARAVR